MTTPNGSRGKGASGKPSHHSSSSSSSPSSRFSQSPSPPRKRPRRSEITDERQLKKLEATPPAARKQRSETSISSKQPSKQSSHNSSETKLNKSSKSSNSSAKKSIRESPRHPKVLKKKSTGNSPTSTKHKKNMATNIYFNRDDMLLQTIEKEFYLRLDLVQRTEYFVLQMHSASNVETNKATESTWRVHIGDFLCIQVPGEQSRGDENARIGKSPTNIKFLQKDNCWLPFNVAWRPCQILSIFRELIPVKRNKNNPKEEVKEELENGSESVWGPWKVELRWFYRLMDLDDRNQRHEFSRLGVRKKRNGKRKLGAANEVKNENNDEEELKEEVFESNHIEVYPASLLLGRLMLDGPGHHSPQQNNEISESATGSLVPTAMCRCHRFYFHKEKDILQLYGGDILARGLKHSLKLRSVEGLLEATQSHLKFPLRDIVEAGDARTEKIGLVVTLLLPPIKMPITQLQNDKHLEYHTSCLLAPPWSQLLNDKLICEPELRPAFPEWQLCVGDIVAVHCNESQPPTGVDNIRGRRRWYPYCVPWSHAQVVAIYRTASPEGGKGKEECSTQTKVPASLVLFKIRWFYRILDAKSECKNVSGKVIRQLDAISEDPRRTAEEIIESNSISTITSDSILGPVFIDDGNANTEDNVLVSPFLHENRRICRIGFLPGKIGHKLRSGDRVRRGIEASTLFTKKTQIIAILDAVMEKRLERAKANKMKLMEVRIGLKSADDLNNSQRRSNIKLNTQVFKEALSSFALVDMPNGSLHQFPPANESTVVGIKSKNIAKRSNRKASFQAESAEVKYSRVICPNEPFHVDLSSMKSFYEEIEITPMAEAYDHSIIATKGDEIVQKSWRVKLGDMVAIEVETTSKILLSHHFPFTVPWGPAEVITIWKSHNANDSCVRLREKLLEKRKAASSHVTVNAVRGDDDDDGDEIMIELRWFYRRHEIPGAMKIPLNAQLNSVDDNQLEEIFETDQIDVCSADAILSPVVLHEENKPLFAPPKTISGMPCIHYQCRRYWSIHRKSFVPSGELCNRIKRGRMHSAYLGKEGTLKTALSLVGNASPKDDSTSPKQITLPWKEAFRSAIQKLSLAEAAADIQVHREELKCREVEFAKIKNFLRGAIRGRRKENDHGAGERIVSVQSSLFIAGPPGTGKTASVRSVMTELQEEQVNGLVPEFNFIYLNGMEMRHPFDAYVKFWEEVSGTKKEKLSPGAAAAELEDYFTREESHMEGDKQKPVTVLLLDEIDYLVTNKQTVLYNFFDWPHRAANRRVGARLVVIGISNTINLPERLTPSVQSRLGGNRIHFQAYNADDTAIILKARLNMLHSGKYGAVFEEDAIRFAARKTSNLSGDIRKAFQMCKAAAEVVLEDHTNGKTVCPDGARPIVRISNVQKASRDMFHSMINMAVSCSSAYEALLFIAIGSLKRTTGREQGSFEVEEILAKMESIANSSGDMRYASSKLSFADVLEMLNRLGDAMIISMIRPRSLNSMWPMVTTQLLPYEILLSFRDTPHYKLAEKHLSDQKLF